MVALGVTRKQTEDCWVVGVGPISIFVSVVNTNSLALLLPLVELRFETTRVFLLGAENVCPWIHHIATIIGLQQRPGMGKCHRRTSESFQICAARIPVAAVMSQMSCSEKPNLSLARNNATQAIAPQLAARLPPALPRL